MKRLKCFLGFHKWIITFISPNENELPYPRDCKYCYKLKREGTNLYGENKI